MPRIIYRNMIQEAVNLRLLGMFKEEKENLGALCCGELQRSCRKAVKNAVNGMLEKVYETLCRESKGW